MSDTTNAEAERERRWESALMAGSDAPSLPQARDATIRAAMALADREQVDLRAERDAALAEQLP